MAREAVRKSLVLLKNGKRANEPILPLPKKASSILVAGTHANNLGYQCGGWTIEWQGGSGDTTVGAYLLIASSFFFSHCIAFILFFKSHFRLSTCPKLDVKFVLIKFLKSINHNM